MTCLAEVCALCVLFELVVAVSQSDQKMAVDITVSGRCALSKHGLLCSGLDSDLIITIFVWNINPTTDKSPFYLSPFTLSAGFLVYCP